MEQLKQALLNTYEWKGAKQKLNGEITQKTIKLVNASKEELQQFFDYSNLMLHNSSASKPGRYTVLCSILDQTNRCNAELLLRWFRNEEKIDQITLSNAIREFTSANKDVIEPKEKLTAQSIASKLPEIFNSVPLTLLEDACLDTLGKFNKKHLTLTFVAKQGINLTPKERAEFTTKVTADKTLKDVIKEQCAIPNTIKIEFKEQGLKYLEFRTIIQMKNDKYSSIPSDQLKLLRDRLLPALHKDVNRHITFWENQKDRIQQVMDSKEETC